MKEVSVIIPVALDESPKEVLDSLKSINYDKEKIEVLLVRGNQPSVQRNEAAKKSEGKYLFFFDNDSILTPEIISIYLSHLKKPEIAGVGGPDLTNPADSFLQQCFGRVLSSFFAMQKMRARYAQIGKFRETSEKELILCNFAMKGEIFLKEGGFNPLLYPNEENEFFSRLTSKGYKFFYDPEAIIYKSRRKGLGKFIKQFITYGRGRTDQVLIRPSSFTPVIMGPPLFLLYLISLIFFHPFWYFLPLFLYFLLDVVYSFFILASQKKVLAIFIIPFLFPIIHISYALGIFYGIFKKMLPKRIKRVSYFIEKLDI